MSKEDFYDELWDLEWVEIPGSLYAVKYKINENDTSCTLMLTDLSGLYGEHLFENELQERFKALNPCVEMKSKILLKHISLSLENSLVKKDTSMELQCTSHTVTINLLLKIKEMSLMFELRPQIMSYEKFRLFIIAPLIHSGLFIAQENELLKSKVHDQVRKESVPQKTKVMQTISSRISKRSKVTAADVFETFLGFQKSISHCISESGILQNEIAESENSASKQSQMSKVSHKRTMKMEEISFESIKPENIKEESLIKAESSLPSTENEPVQTKAKKKKQFKF